MLRYVDERHADSHYEEEILALIDALNTMRSLMLEQFNMLQKLLDDPAGNKSGAKNKAQDIDKEINALQSQVDKNVLNMLVRHSPQLVELRFILSASKLAGQFERMGDHCKNSIKRLCRADDKISEAVHERLVHLAQVTQPLLVALENALLRFDNNAAKIALEADDAVDKVFKKLVVKMPKVLDDEGVENEAVSDVLFIGKNLERLADHATDIICEAYYIHNGERIPFDD